MKINLKKMNQTGKQHPPNPRSAIVASLFQEFHTAVPLLQKFYTFLVVLVGCSSEH